MYASFAPEIGIWLPLWKNGKVTTNAVAFFNYIPGSSIIARDDDTENPRIVRVKSSRYNCGAGINAWRNLPYNYFVMGMLGAGVTFIHPKAEYVRGTGGSSTYSEHPGPTFARPFAKVKVGFGKNVNARTQLLAFVSESICKTEGTFILTGNGGDRFDVRVKSTNHWYMVGLEVTRAIGFAGTQANTEDNIRIALSGAGVFYPRMEIVSGNTSDRILVNGLNNNDMYDTFAPEIGIWLPLWKEGKVIVNAATFFNYIPGSSMTADNGRYGYSDFGIIRVKSSRYNWGVGINALRDLPHNYFVMGMLGGGVTFLHTKAECIEQTGADTESDHPGPTFARPFAKVKVGFGKNVNAKTQLLAFASVSVCKPEGTFIMAGNGQNEFNARVQPTNHWYMVGLEITRAIGL
jgi:hypothetical protein